MKPTISLIAAMAKNRVIGKGNQMPWHLPADLLHFKQKTLGKPIIMGRKTFESIGRSLPGRQNIVISRNSDYVAAGCELASSIEDALKIAASKEEVMIIGGGFLYSQTLAMADNLYLTFIELEVEGDTCFPDYTQLDLTEVKRTTCAPDDKNQFHYEFVDYKINR